MKIRADTKRKNRNIRNGGSIIGENFQNDSEWKCKNESFLKL
jgi:hypothetical protein